eukprot:COSAG06_NODE_15430_length_1071_cov_1.188272_1_plen_263_part_10
MNVPEVARRSRPGESPCEFPTELAAYIGRRRPSAMPKNKQFANPMLGGGDADTGLSDDLLDDDSGSDSDDGTSRVEASKSVREALEKVSEAKKGALTHGASVQSHIVLESKAIMEQLKMQGVNPEVEDPFVPVAERDMTDHKSKAKFKAFVRETMLERLVFGTRDPMAEEAMVEALWTGEAFDSDKKIEQPGGLWTGLLYPESSVRLWYDALQMVAVGYTSVMVPLRLAFDSTPVPGTMEFAIDVAIDMFFIFDIYLNFFNYY